MHSDSISPHYNSAHNLSITTRDRRAEPKPARYVTLYGIITTFSSIHCTAARPCKRNSVTIGM